MLIAVSDLHFLLLTEYPLFHTMTPGGSPDEAGSSSSRPIDPSPSSLTGLQHLISATRQLGQPVVHRLSNASSRPTAPTSKRPSGDARASLSPPPPDRLGSPSISLNGSSLHPVTELVAQEEGHATVRTVPSTLLPSWARR